MKLLHVVHHPTFSGPHNQAIELRGALEAAGWETHVLIPTEPGNARGRLEEAGVPFTAMPLGRLRATKNLVRQARYFASIGGDISRIRALIRREHVDLVVVTGLTNPHAAIAARFEGVPVTWQLLDTRSPRILRALMMPVVLFLSDTVMTTGHEVARVHPGALRLGERLVPYFPPVDTSKFRPDAKLRDCARAELRVPAGARVVGTVGNLNPQKGHEYFVEAGAMIAARDPQVVLRIVGAPTPTHLPYEAMVGRQAEDLGLLEGGRLTFTDPGSRVHELLPAFDVFILPSVPRSEGIPTVILEAMACAIPVVATDVGAVREVVEDGTTGFVRPPLDAGALAEAAMNLMDDPAMAAAFGETARARALQRYTVERCCETHVRAFTLALNRRRALIASTFPETPGAGDDAAALRALLVCPACHGALAWHATQATCAACRAGYPVIDGIPVFASPAAGIAEAACTSPQTGPGEDPGLETLTPHGANRLRRFLVGDTLRRGIDRLNGLPAGSTALAIGGDPGIAAEFLARAGCQVIVSSDTLDAAATARARARRYGLPIFPIVADAGQLPFAAQSVDLVFAHDGLQGPGDPAARLAEVARAAARALSINEAATGLGVRAISAALTAAGLEVHSEARFRVFNGPLPDHLSRFLSAPGIFATSQAAARLLNKLTGRFGNRIAVQAVRPPTP